MGARYRSADDVAEAGTVQHNRSIGDAGTATDPPKGGWSVRGT
jgi:hypothetical protein